ncbi:MAG TPA: VOC family protein [Propionibacteriaceae bacterium]|nr:VOC family protein [Propionibacteriaceae bacterium]
MDTTMHGVTAMDITIHASFLPHNDPDASLAFYRDTLGFEVRNDVGYNGMRWITVGPADQPGTSIVLEPPAVDPVGCRLVVPTVDFAPRRSS